MKRRIGPANALPLLFLALAVVYGFAEAEPPTVYLMDSSLRHLVFDQNTPNGDSNADELERVLRELPVAVVKEDTKPVWEGQEALRTANPDLILINIDAFSHEERIGKDRAADERFRDFMSAMLPSRSKFIVYKREPEGAVGEVTYYFYIAQMSFLGHRDLRGRVRVFWLPRSRGSFRKDRKYEKTRQEMRLLVACVLQLENGTPCETLYEELDERNGRFVVDP